MADEIINKVAGSALFQLDMETYYPKEAIATFDLQPFLFMGLILKEKDFREGLLQHDWSVYQGKVVGVTCSADAIIPAWAYMLVATYLAPVAKDIVFGTEKEVLKQLFLRNINSMDPEQFRDQRIVVKGCGDLEIEAYVYLEVAKKLQPVCKSLMYGEPCSTVPIFKSKMKNTQ